MRVLLNGLGRIGKSILRISLDTDTFDIVAINEINRNKKNIAYSLNYDSTYGRIDDRFELEGDCIVNGRNKIKILNHTKLEDIDFKKEGIDLIIDASGTKIDMEILEKLEVEKIFLTHPREDAHINMVLGVNEDKLDLKKDKVISTSSCNATALLPVLKLLDENYGIDFGNITTVHPLLNHQKVLDAGCIGSDDRGVDCNFEFGRSSTQNIIPSRTTTLNACSFVLPKIDYNNISSNSFRVPTATVGAIDVSLVLKSDCTKEQLIGDFMESEKAQKYKVLLNNEEPLVSSDFEKEPFTTIIDHRFTDVKKRLVKLNIWYDNEWGYASKVVDIVSYCIDN